MLIKRRQIMDKSGTISGNRQLRIIRSVIEILNQCIVFMAFSAMIIFGITRKPADYMAYVLMMCIPVVASYFSRKYIKPFFLFALIHGIFIVLAVIVGRTDAEVTAYIVCNLAVCIRSMSIRFANVRKTEYMNMSQYGNGIDDIGKDEKKAILQAGESVPVYYCVIMVIGCIIGGQADSSVLMGCEVFFFVVFILLAFAGNQVKALNELFLSNVGKSEFPAKRMIKINVIMAAVISMLMIAGMVVFYQGRYGNIFSIAGAGIMYALKYILKFLLAIMREKDEEVKYVETPTQTESEGDGVAPSAMEFDDNPVMGALFTAFAVVVIIALLALMIYLIYRYTKKFKEARDDNGDKIEFIGRDRKEERRLRKEKDSEQKSSMPVNLQYRKAFKKAVVRNNKKNGPSMDKLANMQPEDITRGNITSDEQYADRITADYEKARYSDKNVSDEELDFLLDFMKHGNYNKHR